MVYFVPETRDRSLEDIDKLFRNSEELAEEEDKKTKLRKTLASGYAPEPFIGPAGTPTNGIRFF